MDRRVQWVFIESQIRGYSGHYYNYVSSFISIVGESLVYVPKNCEICSDTYLKALEPFDPPKAGSNIFLSKIRSFFYQLLMTRKRMKELAWILKQYSKSENLTQVLWTTPDDFELISLLLVSVPDNVLLAGIQHVKVQSLYAKIMLIIISCCGLQDVRRKVIGYNSEKLQDQLEGLGCRISGILVPYPFHRPNMHDDKFAEGEKLYISYLGTARKEKGINLFLSALIRLIELSKVFIQCTTTGRPEPEVVEQMAISRKAVVNDDRIIWWDQELTSEEYLKAVKQSKVIVLAYEPDKYVGRVSGILGEALISGIPVVVSPDTWLADQIERYGGGVVMKDMSVDSLIEAITHVLENLDSFQDSAKSAGQLFYEYNNPARVLDAIIHKEKEK